MKRIIRIGKTRYEIENEDDLIITVLTRIIVYKMISKYMSFQSINCFNFFKTIWTFKLFNFRF
jgi:hypothetical protein